MHDHDLEEAKRFLDDFLNHKLFREIIEQTRKRLYDEMCDADPSYETLIKHQSRCVALESIVNELKSFENKTIFSLNTHKTES